MPDSNDDDTPEHREDIETPPPQSPEDYTSTDNLLTPNPDYDSDEETITPQTATASGQIRGSSAIPMYPVNSPRGPSLAGTSPDRGGACCCQCGWGWEWRVWRWRAGCLGGESGDEGA